MYVGECAGTYRYQMNPEMYSTLDTKKVIDEAAGKSGISRGVLQAAWEAIGNVIKTWATEGHSVSVPGLGKMRFGVNATTVDDVGKVAASLITSRKVIFTPAVDIKQALKDTSISITCIDRYGNIVKRVTSGDDGDVNENENSGGGTGGSENSGGGTGGGENSGGGSDTGGTGTDDEDVSLG